MDKPISELIEALSVLDEDLYVLEQGGEAKKLKWSTFIKFAAARLDGHGGIQSIALTGTSGLVDTYTITLADAKTYDIVVKNGRGISGIVKTGTSGLVDTYTITYNDGSTDKITVTNGAKGDPGNNAYVWIKYASQEPTEASHSMGDVPDAWMGVYSGNSATAPTDWNQYKWYKIEGRQGDTGAPAALISAEVTYQVSDSGTIVPSGDWTASVPVVAQGKYLWTRTVQQYNTGSPITAYSVSRMGMDGLGSVSSVCNVSPDADGNVTLSASDVGALPTTGGDMTGELRMNGQPISGLNEPTEGTQATPKSYVDKRVPLDGSVPMTGNLSMGAHRITGLTEPEDGGDAATKGYTDTKASLPKTASGTVIALSDASSGPLQGLRIFGRTTQDGTPTPDNPVPLVSVGDGGSVGVTVAGKNLVTGITNGNSANNYAAALYAKVDTLAPDTDYFISFVGASGNKCYSNENVFNYAVFTCTGSRQGLRIHTKKSISKDNNSQYNPEYGWYIFKNNAGNTVVPSFTDVQIEAGTVMTDYEAPVPAQTLPISTPNGLPGIPVTSGGNYTDADGQQWICDEVDLARGVYVQRVALLNKTFFLSNKEVILSESIRFRVTDKSLFPPDGDINALCTHYTRADSISESPTSGMFYVYKYEEWSYARIRFANDKGFATWDDFYTWLDVNDLCVIYPLSTPIETPIPADDLAAYAALHTNRPNTTVYNDAGAHMEVGYYPPDSTMRQEDIMDALDNVGNAAKEYVDAKHFIATVSLPAASWVGDAAPYTQTVTVSGILATDFPHVTPVYSSTLATALAQKEAWSMVNMGVPGAGEITFTCFEDKPATEIPIQIEVMR